MTVWSMASGATPDRSSAARAAIPPSSIADRSRNARPYSPIGVRAPPRMTTAFDIVSTAVPDSLDTPVSRLFLNYQKRNEPSKLGRIGDWRLGIEVEDRG